MYIAANNCLERGYFLGDVLTIIKTAWLFVNNEPHEHTILSLLDYDPLNFLWARFIRENCVTVVHDHWPKGDCDFHYRTLEQRLAERHVKTIPFSTYKELYPRMDGGGRQGFLCGRENGLGRPNIFGYYYYGQQAWNDDPCGLLSFDSDLVEIPCGIAVKPRTVFVAPHEKCQGNGVFSLDFWRRVILRLIGQEVYVTVNDSSGFMADSEGTFLCRTFVPFSYLPDQVVSHMVVASGNSGIGWLAAALGKPLVACEHDQMLFSEYSFRRSGCQSLVACVTEPDSDRMAECILAALEGRKSTVATA
jgi:hypothetical protein